MGLSLAIGTSSNVTEGSDIKVPKLLDFIEVSDPKAAKAGEIVRFMHDAKENDGLFYWLEGKILGSHEGIKIKTSEIQ